MVGSDAKIWAQPTDIFRVLAYGFGRPERDIALYARFLREGSRNADDAWPAISAGRGAKFEVSPRHAVMLLLALSTSWAARTCADAAEKHASLSADLEGEPITLVSFLESRLIARDAELDLEFNPPWAAATIKWRQIVKIRNQAAIQSLQKALEMEFRDQHVIAFDRQRWFHRASWVRAPMFWELSSTFYDAEQIKSFGRQGSPPWELDCARRRGLIPPESFGDIILGEERTDGITIPLFGDDSTA